MYKMQLDKLSDRAVSNLVPFFHDIPTTDHADGQYRLRRYSRVSMNPETMVYSRLDGTEFTQSSEYNTFQGDVARKFEGIPDDLISSYGFWELCSRFITTFRLPTQNVIEVHQMRVITLNDETHVSPEGIHQDGFDGICIASIDRDNVEGGHLLLYKSKDNPPIANFALESGELVYVNDRDLWHNDTPITREDTGRDGHMDVFVLTARKNATV